MLLSGVIGLPYLVSTRPFQTVVFDLVTFNLNLTVCPTSQVR
jgi:hypothetical protein